MLNELERDITLLLVLLLLLLVVLLVDEYGSLLVALLFDVVDLELEFR